MVKEKLKIKNKFNDNLTADLRYNEYENKLPLLIFIHGFKGFKNWGCFPYMLNKFAENIIFAISFNFSYNGVGENDEEMTYFTRLDLFAKNTFSRELDDLGCIIDYLEKNRTEYNYDFENLVLAGHSRGGGIAILKTAEDKRIKKLITLASVSEFDRYPEERKKEWKERGYFQVLNTRTKQYMRMDYTLIEDLEKNRERLDIKKAVSKLTVPYLIIHGEEDLAVDYSEALELHSLSNKNLTKLELIANTGHTFGAVHPFEGTTDKLEQIIKSIRGFIYSDNQL
ncbi:MAG: alpha/beta hydrolase [Ignavibacteria bacterium]|nr:alpha/beta hydrolase [Ignavibacteria bacterium]